MHYIRLAALSALVFSAPASATRFEVTAIGTLSASAAPGQTLDGLPFGTGSFVVGRWTVDIAAGTPVDQTPPGTPVSGQARLIFGAVRGGSVSIQSTAGNIFLSQSNNSTGALYALNDVAGGPSRLVDQLTLTDGARVTPDGLIQGYTNDRGGFLPPGVFLGSVAFGKALGGPVETPPTLRTSLDDIDPFALWQTGRMCSP